MISPVEAVRLPDPYPYYGRLVAERPFYFDEGLSAWVAGDAAAVTAVLAHPGMRVRPPHEAVPPGIDGTPAGEVFGKLVRMIDGDLHERLKRVVVDTLGQVDRDEIGKLAAEHTRRSLRASPAPRLADLMFGVPARVVAGACGLDDGASAESSRLIGDFVGCLPASASPAEQAAAARAAARLQEVMGPALSARSAGLLGELVRAAQRADWHDTAPLLANGIGFLSQTYDATAGLIGNTLLALARRPTTRPAPLDRFVTEVVRHDAPVQNTRRFAWAPFRHGEAYLPAGQAVLVLLAAANRDPAVNRDPDEFRVDRAEPVMFTFGSGRHRCPGEALAVTIATTVVEELLASGFAPADLPPRVAYRPLPNVRIPVL